MPRILPAFVVALAAPFLCGPAFAAEVNVPASSSGAELTVYNSDLALVRERRSFQLPTAGAQLAFTGVSGRMMPETALLEVTKGNPVKINEQTFSFNVISPATLLERSVGKEVSVYLPNAAGRDVPVKARVLAAEGPVVEIEGKVHAGFGGRIMYDSLPQGLRSTPTLVMDVVGTAGNADAEFSYLTGGVMWQADYVVHYDADAARMDLTGWATITNTTGVDFKEAKLKLVAGDVNRVSRPGIPGPMRMMEAKAMAAPASNMADGVDESQLESNHLYTIAKPVTLADKETKQLSLLSGNAIPVVRELVVRNNQIYLYQSQMRGPIGGENRAALELAFKNDKASKLGLPLPAGTVRVYGMDEQGSAQFIGESSIGHTASGSEVRIGLGRDFDVPVTREQTTFVRASDTITVSAWKITVRNAKARPVKVRVIEPMPSSWEITKESHPHKTGNASTMEWVLDVPAKGETVLEYNVKSVF